MTGKDDIRREESAAEMDEGGALCPHCLAPVDDLDHFCPACARPITSHATIDPMGQVYSAGHAYRQATESPKLITVIGIWLIFGPQVPLLFCSITTVGAEFTVAGQSSFAGPSISLAEGVAGIFAMLISGAIDVIYIMILWKVTRAYLRNRPWDGKRCMQCGYDLRGTVAAGNQQCPECGWAFGADDADDQDVAVDVRERRGERATPS
jgi:hypothetical protein